MSDSKLPKFVSREYDDKPRLSVCDYLLEQYIGNSAFPLYNFKKFLMNDPEYNPSTFVEIYVSIILGLMSKNFCHLEILHVLSFFTITKYAYQYKILENGNKYPICKMSNLCFSPQNIINQIAKKLQTRMSDIIFSDELSYCRGKHRSFDPVQFYLIHLMFQAQPEFLNKIRDLDKKCFDEYNEKKKKRAEYIHNIDTIYNNPDVQKVRAEFLRVEYTYREACENVKLGNIPINEISKYMKNARTPYHETRKKTMDFCQNLTLEAKKSGYDIEIDFQNFIQGTRKYNACPYVINESPISLESLCEFVKDSFILDNEKCETYNPVHIWENWDLWMKNEDVKKHQIIQTILQLHQAQQLADKKVSK